MRRLLLFGVLLCSIVASAQEPQWVVVSHVSAFNQAQGVPNTTLLTPPEDGFYRVTLYFSLPAGSANTPGVVAPAYYGTDVTGLGVGGGYSLNCFEATYRQLGPFMYALKSGQPFGYSVSLAGNGCTYNLGITVEHLQ